MKDSIIKKILEDNGVSYKTTPKYFQIPREVHMNSKAPKWFEEFEKRNNDRFDKLEAKVDKNTNMILKAHPEFNK